jgi:hypothetical protein
MAASKTRHRGPGVTAFRVHEFMHLACVPTPPTC